METNNRIKIFSDNKAITMMGKKRVDVTKAGKCGYMEINQKDHKEHLNGWQNKDIANAVLVVYVLADALQHDISVYRGNKAPVNDLSHYGYY